MLTPVSYPDLEYICFNMRERDQDEIYALRPYDNPFRLAWDANIAINNMGRGKISWVNGRPAAVAAFTQHHPGCWEVWMFGTDAFEKAALPLLGWVRREAIDILANVEAHRLQCDSKSDYVSAHRMIEAMGAERESVLRRYGKDGSDFIRFVWLKGEHDSVLAAGHTRQKETA